MVTPVFVKDKRVKQSKEAKFYRIRSRAWEFCALLLHRLGSLSGPLRFGLSNYNIDRFIKLRIRAIFYENFNREEYYIRKEGGID
jgi:hypothetical protein